jgi:ribosome maturation protein Sdo1
MFGMFFNTAEVDRFAKAVVSELLKLSPPEGAEGGKQAADRRKKLDDRLRRMIDQLARDVRLNVYQKAKLGPRLQDAMEDAGYSTEFSKSFSYEVVIRVAQSAPRAGH